MYARNSGREGETLPSSTRAASASADSTSPASSGSGARSRAAARRRPRGRRPGADGRTRPRRRRSRARGRRGRPRGRPARAAPPARAARADRVMRLVLPVLERLADVRGHQPGGAVAVARLDRGGDRAVLGDVGPLPLRARRARGEQPAPDLDDPHRLEHAGQLAVAGRGRDREVEGAARVMGGDPRRRRLLGRDRRSELREVGIGAPLRGQPRDPRLDERADLEPPQDVVDARARRTEAAVGQELREPLAGQPAQRLADRRARDAELLGELDLPEPRARGDLPRVDHRPDPLVGEVDHGVRSDVSG